MSSSVLRQRLTELVDAALVEQRPDTTYALTELGHGASRALRPLDRWSAEWAGSLAARRPAPDPTERTGHLPSGA